MSIIRSTYQLDGLITLDNIKQIAVFSDFDSAVLFRAHHPAWEVHIHLVIPRAPQTPPTSATVRPQPPLESDTKRTLRQAQCTKVPTRKGEANQPALRLRHVSTGSTVAQASSPHISAYLTDGETIYKQAIFTAEQLGLANEHAQTETDGLLYWEKQPTEQLGLASVAFGTNAKGVANKQRHYRVVEEAILTNSNSLA